MGIVQDTCLNDTHKGRGVFSEVRTASVLHRAVFLFDCGEGIDPVDFDARVDVVADNCENRDRH
jgi:hypothetical protein